MRGLPAAFTTRPLDLTDAAAVTSLIQADELDLTGSTLLSEQELIGHWRRPSFHLRTDTVGVFDVDGIVVAAAEVFQGQRAEVVVRPDRRGTGIGSGLLTWTEAAARAAGSAQVGQTVPVGHAAARALLDSAGYRQLWTSWVLLRASPEAAEPIAAPGGYSIRQMASGEERAVFQVVEDAFGEWPQRAPVAFDDWIVTTVERPDAQAWQFQVAVASSGDVVGAAVLSVVSDDGWVDQLAVRNDHRSNGLARCLLNVAFSEFEAQEIHRVVLSTDSRTGALGLYLHVGMTVWQEWIHLSKQLF